MKRPQSFVVSSFSARDASGIRFWTFSGSVLGGFWPSRWLKPLLEILLERPRADQEELCSVLEPSKSPPEAPRSAPRGLRETTSLPRQLQESPRDSKNDFGAILGSILEHFGAIWRAENRAENRAESRNVAQSSLRIGLLGSSSALGRLLNCLRMETCWTAE